MRGGLLYTLRAPVRVRRGGYQGAGPHCERSFTSDPPRCDSSCCQNSARGSVDRRPQSATTLDAPTPLRRGGSSALPAGALVRAVHAVCAAAVDETAGSAPALLQAANPSRTLLTSLCAACSMLSWPGAQAARPAGAGCMSTPCRAARALPRWGAGKRDVAAVDGAPVNSSSLGAGGERAAWCVLRCAVPAGCESSVFPT